MPKANYWSSQLITPVLPLTIHGARAGYLIALKTYRSVDSSVWRKLCYSADREYMLNDLIDDTGVVEKCQSSADSNIER